MKKHVILGFGAGVLLLLFYAGIIALAQGWQHVLEQTVRLWYWIVLLAIGFGTQVGLFSFIRQSLRRKRGAVASVATSGGVSAGSMAACCAHHLTDILAVLGLSGLATFLVSYQLAFIILGVVLNIVGVAFMVIIMRRHSLLGKASRILPESFEVLEG